MTTARWLRLFSENLGVNKSPNYTLATTVEQNGTPIPRSRTVIHRQLLTIAPQKSLLITTTDIRSPKADQLVNNPLSEATFWFADSQEQFRITAKAYLLTDPNHPWRHLFPGDKLSGDEDFDWEEYRLNTYDSLSPYLRASFVRPIPGTPMKSYDEANSWPQTLPARHEAKTEDKQNVEEALRNFAVLVLDSFHVDLVELGVYPNRRTSWNLEGEKVWNEQILVP